MKKKKKNRKIFIKKYLGINNHNKFKEEKKNLNKELNKQIIIIIFLISHFIE